MSLVFGVLVAILVVLIVALALVPPAARVNDETVVPRDQATVERRLFGALASIRASQLETTGPGHMALRSSYTPGWAIFVAVVFFPVGLLAVLVAKRRLVLNVRLQEDGKGRTRVQVAGQSRWRVARAVGAAVDELCVRVAGAARTPR